MASKEWLRWACQQSIIALIKMFSNQKQHKLNGEPEEGRPGDDVDLFVAWWKHDGTKTALRSCAYGGSDLLDLIVVSTEGDSVHDPLLASEFSSLGVSVGVATPLDKTKKNIKAAAAKDGKEAAEDFLVIGDDWVLWGAHADEEQVKESVATCVVMTMERVRVKDLTEDGGGGKNKKGSKKNEKEDDDEKEDKKSSGGGGGGGGCWSLRNVLILTAFVAVLLWLRYNDATYDVQWEEFYEHYGVLGLEIGAPFHQAKKAYHKLSLKEHPDKLGDKCGPPCHERWTRISNAYAALKDYNSGKLRLLNRPTRFDKEF